MTINLGNLGNIGHIGDGWKAMRQALTRAATADVTQRARTVLARDLPQWLAELGVDLSVAVPLDLEDVRAELAAQLSQLVRVCGEEHKALRAWHRWQPLGGGHRALALKLALDRVVGALVPLEATIARAALALRRGDPRLAAIGATIATLVSPSSTPSRPATFPGGITTGPLADLCARDSHKLAESLRGVLSQAARAAHAVQRTLDREDRERPAGSGDIAGAIEQTHTLVAWLRRECECTAGHLLRRVDA